MIFLWAGLYLAGVVLTLVMLGCMKMVCRHPWEDKFWMGDGCQFLHCSECRRMQPGDAKAIAIFWPLVATFYAVAGVMVAVFGSASWLMSLVLDKVNR